VSDRAEVLAKYTRKGVLRQIPARSVARLEVLGWLAEQFAPGRTYAESEVNALLGGHEVDYATLRRLLVDYGFLARQHSTYHRVDTSQPDADEN
jgi:hypothetical protein